jgi:hypothetical protein
MRKIMYMALNPQVKWTKMKIGRQATATTTNNTEINLAGSLPLCLSSTGFYCILCCLMNNPTIFAEGVTASSTHTVTT